MFFQQIVAISAAVAAPTLAGVALGSPLSVVQEAHPDAKTVKKVSNGVHTSTVWRRRGGGTVAVSTNRQGIITRIDFTAEAGEQDSIDLPCAKKFSIEGSHANLTFAADPSVCTLVPPDVGKYTLKDGSMFEATFGPGDGSLLEATWYVPQHQASTPLSLGDRLRLTVPSGISVRQREVNFETDEYDLYDAKTAPLLVIVGGGGAYDLKAFKKTCLNGRPAWTADRGGSGTVVVGEPGFNAIAAYWTDLAGARLHTARAIVSSISTDLGAAC